jgi:hypothetical protein
MDGARQSSLTLLVRFRDMREVSADRRKSWSFRDNEGKESDKVSRAKK